jgi:hypothetical protein
LFNWCVAWVTLVFLSFSHAFGLATY